MTISQFKQIASITANVFWPAVYQHLPHEEIFYLKTTPSARRNLDKRIIRALAETLLSPDQISQDLDLELEDPQTDITDPESGPHTESKEYPL